MKTDDDMQELKQLMRDFSNELRENTIQTKLINERLSGDNGALPQLRELKSDVSKLKKFKWHLTGLATGASLAVHWLIELFTKGNKQ